MSKQNNNNAIASVVKQLKEKPGLFTCLLEHKVVKTTADLKWTGPKIPEQVWNEVLAFFQWTYDETRSESQVRLYVNPRTNTWAAWAFPQEARTGMSAKELDSHPKFAEQRLQFNPDEGWVYFGTAHHHCATGAFQSSVDMQDEKDKDGLHITVGNMDSKTYTMHDRFYLAGNLIAHDMSWFWDIGDFLEDVPQWARKFLPEDIKDRVARGQMCVKAPENTTFPQEWKDNLVAKKYEPPTAVTATHWSSNGGLGYTEHNHEPFQRKVSNLDFDLRNARRQFPALCKECGFTEPEALKMMDDILEQSPFLCGLINLMYRNDVSLDKFTDFVEMDIIGKEAKEEREKNERAADDGMPDYTGMMQ